jgi:NAD(P)-dependent dehydrogenase (short-subunit alcohol dehydrogenase family)
MTAALLPLLRKAEDPNVVVIASIAGLANQRATGSLTYGVSKVCMA